MATENLPAPPPTRCRPPARWLFRGGWALVLLGLVGYAVQLAALKQFFVPWYAPVLATAGVLAMLLAVRQRWSVLRVLGLVLALLLTAGEWFFLVSLSRAPTYAGPATGQHVPTFAAIRADGTSFSDRDLASQPTILVFFRGHW